MFLIGVPHERHLLLDNNDKALSLVIITFAKLPKHAPIMNASIGIFLEFNYKFERSKTHVCDPVANEAHASVAAPVERLFNPS